MDASVYNAVAARANRHCENCGSNGYPYPLEADHQFGRPPRADETEFHVWLLCRPCHHNKTNNRPSAAHHLLAFIRHCGRYARKPGTEGYEQDGYVRAALEAQKKLEWLRAKGTSGEMTHG